MDEAQQHSGGDPALGWVGPLPEAVRQRVVSLASATLPELPSDEVPAALRPFVRFAPNRRAKLAANPLAAAVEGHAGFRLRVAERLRANSPELATAVEEGQTPPAADPVDVAVAAYLLRPSGWTEIVGAAGEEVGRAEALEAAEREAEQVERLREQLNQARSSARETRDRLRADIARLKEENQHLRRTVHQARERARAAERKVEKFSTEAEQARADASAQASRYDAELRRVRAKLADAENAIEAGRRAAREGRDSESMRLRLLVDTLVEAAQGLRRELALPPSSERPADLVAAEEPGSAPSAASVTAYASDDGVALATLLGLPRAHLIVDGYNVTKTAWPSLPLESQRSRLTSALGDLVARTGAETTCVFDGADLTNPPAMAVPRGVRVRFSPAGVTADDVIARLVEAEPNGRPVVVVSSDREVAEHARSAGARPVAADALIRQLGG